MGFVIPDLSAVDLPVEEEPEEFSSAKFRARTGGLGDKFFIEQDDSQLDAFSAMVLNTSARLANPNAARLKNEILSPMEWLSDPYFSGPLKRQFWPQKIKDFPTIADGSTTEVILTGSISGGKTQLLKGLAMYDLYRLSCFKDPQEALGLMASETLLFVLISLNVNKSKAKLFTPLKAALDATPYFRQEFPYDRKYDSYLWWPKANIKVVCGITGEGAIHSEDTIFVGISEANFLPVIGESKKKRGGPSSELDVAHDLLVNTIRRMKSRFMRGSNLPMCRLVLDSSRQYPEDFLERRIKEIEAGDVKHRAVIISRSIWEAKAGVKDDDGNPIFGGDTFPVEIGTDTNFSRILTESEVPHARGEIMRVPVELRSDFEKDLEGSIRDFGGRAVLGLRIFISNRRVIQECIRDEDVLSAQGQPVWAEHECQHPWSAATTTLRDAVRFLPSLLQDPITRRPRINPDAPRTAHIDIAVTQDAAGIALGHVARMVTVQQGGLDAARLNLQCVACRGEKILECGRCKGSGKSKQWGVSVDCYSCKGKGGKPCKACNGSGKHGAAVSKPEVYMDLMLRVLPPEGGQIQIGDLEALLAELRKMGFFIPVVTADAHQSVYLLQRQIEMYGAKVSEKLSVDTSKAPYLCLRDAMTDVGDETGRHRLSCYYYEPFMTEAKFLEDRSNKVDHPPGGTKDVTDAVAGVVYNCERYGFLQRYSPGTVLSISLNSSDAA